MATKAGTYPPTAANRNDSDKWVNVTWMPHSALSQTSHVRLSIRSAHAVLDGISHRDDENDWRVRIGVYGVAGLPLVPLSIQSTSAPVQKRPSRSSGSVTVSHSVMSPRATVAKATHDCEWNYFANVPIRWRDLPRDAYLHFEVLETDSVIYQCTMPFFSKYGKLETGLRKLKLTSGALDERRNHGLVEKSDSSEDNCAVWKACLALDQIERMEERTRADPTVVGLETFGHIPCVPWLDSLMKQRAKDIIASGVLEGTDAALLEEVGASLIVELPVFDIPIMHEETFYPLPQNGTCGIVAPVDLASYRKKIANGQLESNSFHPLQLVPFLDYENEADNPVEEKYRTLAHDLLRGLVDPALKPDREQRNRLVNIIDSPSHHPTREEKDLLWRFRFSLVDNRRALTKFLLAVDWTVESEVVQAAELLEQWRMRSPIEVTDALKLLGKNVAFQTNLVRDYAIDTLTSAPDSELRLYLLQLVQALKYENVQLIDGSSTRAGGTESPTTSIAARVPSLAKFLINRAAANIQLANYLYWYLKVETEGQTHGAYYRDVFAALEARLSCTPFLTNGLVETPKPAEDTIAPLKSIVDSVSKLGSSLRKAEQPGDDMDLSAKEKDAAERSMWQVLVEQDMFITGVLDIQQRCRDFRGKKDAKEVELKALLSKEGFYRNAKRDLIPLPSRPDIFINGVIPETAMMFKSALYPALLEFNVEGLMVLDNPVPTSFDVPMTRYKVIVKTGDDLRQDQLIIMMIQLMDGLLKRGALDLCLTPYSVIATSPTSGLVEFVDQSMPISQVLSKFNGSIMQYFQTVAPQAGAKYCVQPAVLSNYVRSCAGYCVITYLLGVGDRHLDNIMLRASGNFFHIDFGFIFGRDPKPLPPAFRLTREMVDGMGGTESNEYRQFCSLSCQAFNALRKSVGLILNLLSLMSDAGIEDLSNNASSNADGVLAKVEERFRLDLTDEQAERFFTGLINDCLAALAPRVMDVLHSIAVSRR